MTLEDRLQGLGGADARGDWLDVQRRARRQRRLRRARWTVAVAAALVLLTISTIAVGDKIGVLDLTPSEEHVPKPVTQDAPAYVFGDVLSIPGRPPGKLAAPLDARFLGTDAPVAVPSPDGRTLLYHAWQRATPLLRAYEISSGRDSTLAEGAQTAAWRRDGRLAYLQALDPTYADTAANWMGGQFGHVVVRADLDSEPVRWTSEPSLYRVWAWAGRTLLAETQELGKYRGIQPPSPRRLLAITGPGRVRELPLSSFIAVSPDGRLVFGAVENRVRSANFLRVVEVETGRVVTELDVRRRTRLVDGRMLVQPETSYVHFGSWSRESIATTASAGEGNALELFLFDGRRLVRRQGLRIDRETLRQAGVPGVVLYAFGRPIFLGGADRELTVLLNVLAGGGNSMVLTCDLRTERCRVGRSFDSLKKSLALVENPSRPLPTPGS